MTKLTILLISIVICSFGATIEGFDLVLSEKFDVSFPTSKIVSDFLFITIGAIISYVSFGTIIAVREGTLLSAILIGRCIQTFMNYIKRPLQKLAIKQKC